MNCTICNHEEIIPGYLFHMDSLKLMILMEEKENRKRDEDAKAHDLSTHRR